MRRRTWLAATILVGLAGCLSPTLPVPPPVVNDVSAPDAEGLVTVKGSSAQANAEVTVWNFNLDGGTGLGCTGGPGCGVGVTRSATPQGAYEIRIQARSGDKLQVWQTVGFERSTSTPDITVP